jgi:hypothetical protein
MAEVTATRSTEQPDEATEIRTCLHGHLVTSENAYVRPSGRLDCRECGRERARQRRRDPKYRREQVKYNQRWRAANPEYHREYNHQYYAARYAEKRAVIDAAKDCPCTDCGQKFPSCAMDLDHVRGEKVASIGAMTPSCTVEEILAEIAKCEPVCANCHRIRHFGENGG